MNTTSHDTRTVQGAAFRQTIRKAKTVWMYVVCVDNYVQVTKAAARDVVAENEVEVSVYADGRVFIDSAPHTRWTK